MARKGGPVTAKPLSHPQRIYTRKIGPVLYSFKVPVKIMFDIFVHLQSAIKIF